MLPPKEIDFGDGPISVSNIRMVTRRYYAPIPRTWSRVQFQMPYDFDAVSKIRDWLETNLTGRYMLYHFTKNAPDERPETVVIRFESRNDALMFKLKDGHNAWQKHGDETL